MPITIIIMSLHLRVVIVFFAEVIIVVFPTITVFVVPTMFNNRDANNVRSDINT